MQITVMCKGITLEFKSQIRLYLNQNDFPYTMRWRFKETHTLEQRKQESTEMRIKYKDRIPVIIEKLPHSNITELDKHKFLVPHDLTVSQFQWTIRKRCQFSASKAIFLFVGRTLPQAWYPIYFVFFALMGEIYQQHMDEDGFLYIAYSGENTFGN
ncbi:unnamed protein product [Oppiella nova]|uniref:Autophagy-related protein n=1 Tax=Oppiella nova TaxID=334625 RepID=A0A7R9LI85_9ACAR|nr:unnamed protein product [Oppiella nova]CAG2163502.1 unnamed protein product [Oppiella nova]